ncbi:eukaryotic translation initiation factor 3 subunit A-like [Micractinium conductrix]|uniref:Eukaryotic translation initiation factor 3 subunit A n=1 Tax=Micractinium conductrix TaxID=554055 RepID=A0A2P6VQV2_9CHLO|nr:eukaryotic translation initiation factor 3 subunit A-like [Micractinium conductrix]|eukprot:PSC76450.1 eukaryotic translation initiation factor 3 subunit A-like [Micractinium conductrix]
MAGFFGGRGGGGFFRGGAPALKPENSIKRAEELLGVGQRAAALQTLHDTITNKRFQRNWNKALEQVMFKYVDICVEMKAGRKCKDALINYRNACQQVNVGSLEDVIKYLLQVATARAEEASKAAEAKLDGVEDLEAEASPEEMMLSYVSGEKSKDRTDRELVTPWFKFLWESYRNVLDILRNNSRLEGLYAMATSRACQFCLTYKRTTEFRRLCDIVRNHLANLLKYRDQGGRDRTDLNVPATWELYVDMRFEQLRTACDLELWAEAFRSVEDIQGLFAMAPKGCKPRPALMATYYAKLTQIFTKSESRLYSAYAWYRLFTFTRLNTKALGGADLSMLASNVVLSALAVLPYEQVGRVDADPSAASERATKMASILGFNIDRRDGRSPLTRDGLLADIEKKGLLSLVPAEVKQLYGLMESDFNPLQLCKVVAPLLESLQGLNQAVSGASPVQDMPLEAFFAPLQRVAVAKMVRQLSEVYSVMRVSTMSELAPFIGFGQAEQMIVDAVRSGYLQARFDHKNNTVHFGGQEVESERVRGHIATMARRLTKALAVINPAPPADKEERRARLVALALETAGKENQRMLARKTEIEKRKEEAEREAMERERLLEEQRAAAEQLAREAEERRKEQERARREAERIQKELEEREQEELKAYLVARGKKVGEGEILDAKIINQEVVSEQLKQQQELQRKLAKLAKQMDHLERARREEEAPLLATGYEVKLKEDEELFHSEAGAFKAAHRAAWEHDLAEKQRLAKMGADRDEVAAAIQARRAEEFAALSAARARALAERREALREERDLARRREYVRRCRLQIEEKRRREEEEEARVEKEKKEKEAAERQRKLDETAERQRQREAELEAKNRADRESAAAAPPPARPTGGGSYVPAHLRAKMGGGAGGPPPERRPSPERRDAAPGAAGPDRERSEERGGGAWRPGGGRRDDGPPGGGGYRPPASRGEGGGAYRPPVGRDEGERGGSYRPPVRREGEEDRGGERGGERGAYRLPVRRGDDDRAPPPRGGGSRW